MPSQRFAFVALVAVPLFPELPIAPSNLAFEVRCGRAEIRRLVGKVGVHVGHAAAAALSLHGAGPAFQGLSHWRRRQVGRRGRHLSGGHGVIRSSVAGRRVRRGRGWHVAIALLALRRRAIGIPGHLRRVSRARAVVRADRGPWVEE